jgi:hypothetical protein
VVEQARFLLGEDHDPSGSVGEALEQNEPPLGGLAASARGESRVVILSAGSPPTLAPSPV